MAKVELSNIIFLHQTTTKTIDYHRLKGCQISFFYIKPQLLLRLGFRYIVVKYHFSTSNHNHCGATHSPLWLSNIIFLHQTTTCYTSFLPFALLSNIIFLHQTTTLEYKRISTNCCQISFFYIKPQLIKFKTYQVVVVKYHFSTSNHNELNLGIEIDALSNIIFLHQTTTRGGNANNGGRCQISFFYIKPQHLFNNFKNICCCQISFFYIKPQLTANEYLFVRGCQISFFYIKPQLSLLVNSSLIVVKYHFSTSNHNLYRLTY